MVFWRRRGARDCFALSRRPTKEFVMNKDKIAGAAKELKGAAETAVGKMTGHVGLQAKGAADQVTGRLQSAVGSLRDTARKSKF